MTGPLPWLRRSDAREPAPTTSSTITARSCWVWAVSPETSTDGRPRRPPPRGRAEGNAQQQDGADHQREQPNLHRIDARRRRLQDAEDRLETEAGSQVREEAETEGRPRQH